MCTTSTGSNRWNDGLYSNKGAEAIEIPERPAV